jgi:hypothetical protein
VVARSRLCVTLGRGYTGARAHTTQQPGQTPDKEIEIKHITIYNGPTNALVCIKTLIQISHTKTFKITPTCFDHQMIIIRELSDPG